MSEEQKFGKEGSSYEQEPPKRRRTPSQYASQIADFKSVSLNPHRITPPSRRDLAAIKLQTFPWHLSHRLGTRPTNL